MTETNTQLGIAALKQGEIDLARGYLSAAVQQNPRDELAWLGLSACWSEVDRKRYCLNQALEINPFNESALRILRKLDEDQSARQKTQPPAAPPVQEDWAPPEPDYEARRHSGPPRPMPRQTPSPNAVKKKNNLLQPVLVLLALLFLFCLLAAGMLLWRYGRFSWLSPYPPQSRSAVSQPTGQAKEQSVATTAPKNIQNPLSQSKLEERIPGALKGAAWGADSHHLLLVTSEEALHLDGYNLQIDWRAPLRGGTSAAYSADGSTIAVGTHWGEIVVFNPANGSEVALIRPEKTVSHLSISADGKTLAAELLGEGEPNETALYRLPMGERLWSTEMVNPQLTPDGRYLIGAYSTLGLWDAQSGQPLIERFGDGSLQMLLSPDGKWAAGYQREKLVLFALPEMNAVYSFDYAGQRLIKTAWQADSKKLMAQFRDAPGVVVDLTDGSSAQAPDMENELLGIAAPDGQLAFQDVINGAMHPSTVQIFEADRPQKSQKLMFFGMVENLKFSPDSRWLVMQPYFDELIRVLKLEQDGALAYSHEIDIAPLYLSVDKDVLFSPDSASLFLNGYYSAAQWETATGKPVASWLAERLEDDSLGLARYASPQELPDDVAYLDNPQLIVLPQTDQALVIDSGTAKMELVNLNDSQVTGRFDEAWDAIDVNDYCWVSRPTPQNTVRLLNVCRGVEVGALPEALFEGAHVISKDGELLASLDFSSSLTLTELNSGKTRWQKDVSYAINALDISPDGRYVAAPGENATAVLFDALGGEVVWRSDAGSLPVSALAFSADGRWLAVGWESGSLRTYAVP